MTKATPFVRHIIGAIVFLALFVPATTFADEFKEVINTYTVHIELQKNGSALVQEEVLYDFGPNAVDKHGIFRTIPLVFKLPNEQRERHIEISSIMVTDGHGQLRQTSFTGGGNYAELKIGDPDVTVTGQQLYVIRYTVWGAIIEGKEIDEFYWNATGDMWPNEIKLSRIEVVLPRELENSRVTRSCYVGPRGAKTVCSASTTTMGIELNTVTTLRWDHAQVLPDFTGITVTVGVSKGVYNIPDRKEERGEIPDYITLYHWWREPFFGFSMLLPIAVFAVMFRVWWTRGRDPKGKGTVITEYDPPRGLDLLEASYLHGGSVTPQALSANIISLATRGYLKITRIEKKGLFTDSTDYQLTLLDKKQPPLTGAELILYQELDKQGSRMTVSELAHQLQPAWQKISAHVPDTLTAKGYFVEDPKKVRMHFVVAGIVLAAISFVLPFLNFSLVLCGVIVFIFGIFMPKVTEKGAEARDHLRGFKVYLSIAEKDRIEFANEPKKNPKVFEKYLPYAMVFGVTQIWAEQFGSMYTEAESKSWYGGGGGGMNATLMASQLSGFSEQSASAFSASGSGGSSGGFSGGGAGGGGGGSW